MNTARYDGRYSDGNTINLLDLLHAPSERQAETVVAVSRATRVAVVTRVDAAYLEDLRRLHERISELGKA
jgi:hypothetical protein